MVINNPVSLYQLNYVCIGWKWVDQWSL